MLNEFIYTLDRFVVEQLEAYVQTVFECIIEGDADPMIPIMTELKGPQILQTIYNYGDVSFDRVESTFQNVSDSITSFFRQNSFSKNDPAKGVVLHDQTCLSMQWAWLAFPSILVLSTLVFFIAMIIDTRPTGNRVPIWKSSPLALVFHGLESPNGYHIDVEDINGMEENLPRHC